MSTKHTCEACGAVVKNRVLCLVIAWVASGASGFAGESAPGLTAPGKPSEASHPAVGGMKLLVIAPQSFDAVLRPFIAHKNQSGLPARLVTLESLRASMAGADDPEKVKRAIAQAHQKLGTRYVMLVGDASLMPVRYRQVQQIPREATADGTYNPSELYYANLYQGHVPGSVPTDPVAIINSGVFDTWDRNGNGRYNEQHWKDDAISYNPDQVDGCPDVAVG
ncbi:MAG TPA: C25 family cysteine peptidase, partial [Methylomirabilota bacterium]|nr:C25 family cysteine peptidase [Methylomirabilota bacterium]